MGDEVWKTRAGRLRGKDSLTGETWVEKKKPVKGEVLQSSGRPRGRPRRDTQWIEVLDSEGRPWKVPYGFNPDHLPSKKWPFSQTTADLICVLIEEGRTLSEVLAQKGMPPKHAIREWRKDFEEFDEAIRASERSRGDYYHDEVARIPRETNKKTAIADRVRLDSLKWLAAKADPDKYGERQKIVGDANAPLQIIVDTGIRRDGDAEPAPIEVAAESSTPQLEPPDES